jgi:hypothetical protein
MDPGGVVGDAEFAFAVSAGVGSVGGVENSTGGVLKIIALCSRADSSLDITEPFISCPQCGQCPIISGMPHVPSPDEQVAPSTTIPSQDWQSPQLPISPHDIPPQEQP